ncbi:MAG TPA: class I SAM-dependent methyltransferase [Bacillota bacterium]|nr:class I SAM-dependent methyltransferase [Bacillota bacterium]
MVYVNLASLYDQLMDETDYNDWIDFTEKHLKSMAFSPQHIVDLGCGTAELTIQLAKRGYSLSGVDIASDMLSQAQQKAIENNVNILWVNQDIRELTGFSETDVFISYFDVLNYITSKNDLTNIFSRIYDCLKDGGLFLFDIHSESYVNNHLLNKTFTEVTDRVAYIWDCIQGEERGEMFHEMTFFSLIENGTFERFDETHHQQVYEPELYAELLSAAQFKNVTFEKKIIKNKETDEIMSEKVFFVAEK